MSAATAQPLSPPVVSSSAAEAASASSQPRRKSLLGSLFTSSKKNIHEGGDSGATKDPSPHEDPTTSIPLDSKANPAPIPSSTAAVDATKATHCPLPSPSNGLTISTAPLPSSSPSSSSSSVVTISTLISSSSESKETTDGGHKTTTTSFFKSLFHKETTTPSSTPTPPPPASPSPPPLDSPPSALSASDPISERRTPTLQIPAGDTRRRSMSDASSRDAPSLSSATTSTLTPSRSVDSSLTQLTAAPPSPALSPAPDGVKKKKGFLSLFSKEGKDTAGGSAHEEASPPLSVAVASSPLESPTYSASSAGVVADSGVQARPSLAITGRGRSQSDASRPSIDSPVRRLGLSSHAQSHSREGGEASPPATERRWSLFGALTGKKEEAGEEDEKEEVHEAAASPRKPSSSPASPSHATGGGSYKQRMAELVARRATADASSTRHVSHSSATSSRAGAVSGTMTANAALAQRNLSAMQQLEGRAAEMEDAADSMLQRARKIKEEAMRKSKWSIF